MKLFVTGSLALLLAVFAGSSSLAQTFASASKSDAEQLEALTKKIDEQNRKIDALSQQLLKLEQQISGIRPGIMIGESTPTPPPAVASIASPSPAAPAATIPAATPAPTANNAHVVAPRETLTSIAKMHKVGVEELRKFNHIEDDRKLQIGQTIMLPPSATLPGSPTPGPPN